MPRTGPSSTGVMVMLGILMPSLMKEAGEEELGMPEPMEILSFL